MTTSRTTQFWKRPGPWIALVLVVGVAAATPWWWKPASQFVAATLGQHPPGSIQEDSEGHHAGDGHDHAGHDHAHSDEGHGHDHASHDHGDHEHAHDDATALELSPAARRNLGLTDEFVQPVHLQNYRRAITVPAVVASRPGRTHLAVSTPLTGVVTHVHAVKGEAVRPGTLLFELRLTHEDLVRSQTEFLKLQGELEVEQQEIERLEDVTRSGAVAGKALLERQYARDKLEAQLQAQREALRLHGLSDRQVDEIAQQRRLLRDLQIVAPSPDEHSDSEELRLSQGPFEPVSLLQDASEQKSDSIPWLTIETLGVHKGQSVIAGEQLCMLADYSKLYIEGIAFEQDAQDVAHAAEQGWSVTAVFDDRESNQIVEGLELAFVANEVDPQSRTLSFFVNLPNRIIRNVTNDEGQRFLTWQYRPGQRLQLRVPVEEWRNQLVVPVAAVATDGAESFVFHKEGDHFDRMPVHVIYRDQRSVVLSGDGQLQPGDIIALRSAHQMLTALKNKAGGGVDPHAGHHH